MGRILTALWLSVATAATSVGAVQLVLDRRAIEEAIYIGQSRIENERVRFHAPYRVRVAQPPVDWIDVITPFHRVELAAEENARRGGRIFGQRDAIEVLRNVENQIDLLVELSFHPLNTFVAVPSYDVELVAGGGTRLSPRRLDRFPRFGPRAESGGPALPTPNALPVFGGGQPVVGGTMIAAVDGTLLGSNERVSVVVREGEKELARATLNLAEMR